MLKQACFFMSSYSAGSPSSILSARWTVPMADESRKDHKRQPRGNCKVGKPSETLPANAGGVDCQVTLIVKQLWEPRRAC